MTARFVTARVRAAALLTLAAVLGGACSQRSGPPSSSDNAGAPSFADTGMPSLASLVSAHPESAQRATTQRRPRTFDLCRLLPADTVAHVLQSTIGKSVATSQTRPGGMCTYRGAPNVSITIDIGRDRSPAAAGVTFVGLRGQLGTRGIATTDVPGIGDAAFGSSDSAGRYTVMMQQDAVTGNVTVSVKGASAQSLRPAAVELAKRTLVALQQPVR